MVFFFNDGLQADLSCRHTRQSVGTVYTRTNFVTLKYVTDAWGTETNGFHLVVTAFKDKSKTLYHSHPHPNRTPFISNINNINNSRGAAVSNFKALGKTDPDDTATPLPFNVKILLIFYSLFFRRRLLDCYWHPQLNWLVETFAVLKTISAYRPICSATASTTAATIRTRPPLPFVQVSH